MEILTQKINKIKEDLDKIMNKERNPLTITNLIFDSNCNWTKLFGKKDVKK